MFDDLYPYGIHFLAPDMVVGVPVFMDEEVAESEDGSGFDEITRTFLLRQPVETVRECLALHFPKGTQLAGLSMWVVKGSGRCVSPHLFLLDVVYRGRLGTGIRYIRLTSAVTQQNSASGVIISMPSGVSGFSYPPTPVSMQSNEGAITATTSYITTAAPDLTGVSNNAGILPAGYPLLPTPPVNKWATIANPSYVAPAGWVLESRDTVAQILNSSGNPVCYHIQDTHTYYHPVRPGGS